MRHHTSSGDASTFKILLTTDNHIGFAERDPRRGDDSFTTFEEVLRAARVEHEVDFALLGGDLFHENKPSLGCMVRTASLLRKYVLGNRPVRFSLLSDPAKNFPTHALPLANFQDPNLNVALPIFAIHGNHDDPVGGTSALDVLATSGYLNYFGHVRSLESLVVEPILLQKGSTFIALYGLGNVRDERLHRCFRHKKVHFVHPKPSPGRTWFNILLLHQNRGVRGVASKGGIYEHMLAGYGFDLVIWGNEHEQLMVPQPSHGYDVVQPGSTILTSLSGQEGNPKQYGILEVRNASYRLTPFPLRSVRPVVRRSVVLAHDNPRGRTLDAVEEFLRSVVEEMLEEAEQQISHIPDDILTFHPNLKFPLMRLAVDFTDAESAPFPQPNLNRFGQQYIDVVANPGELLRPVKPKSTGSGALARSLPSNRGGVAEGLVEWVVPVAPQLGVLDIRAKVAEVFNQGAKEGCALLSEPEVSAAVYAFAEKGERDAIDERIMELLNTSQKMVWRRLGNGESEAILKPDRITVEVEKHKREMNLRYARTLRSEAEAEARADATPDRAISANAQTRAIAGETPHPTAPSAIPADAEGGGIDDDDDDLAERQRRAQRWCSDVFNSALASTPLEWGGEGASERGDARARIDRASQRNPPPMNDRDRDRDRAGFDERPAQPPAAPIPIPAGEVDELEELPSDGLDRPPARAMTGWGAMEAGDSMGTHPEAPGFPPARAMDSFFGQPPAKRPRDGGRGGGGRGRGRGGGGASAAKGIINVSDGDDDVGEGLVPGMGRSIRGNPPPSSPTDPRGLPGVGKTNARRRGGGRRGGGASAEAERPSAARRKNHPAAAPSSLGMPVLNLVYHPTTSRVGGGEEEGGGSANQPTSIRASEAGNPTEAPMLHLLSRWSSQS